MTRCDHCPGCGERDPNWHGYSCRLLQRKGYEFQHDCPLGEVLTELQNKNHDLQGEIWKLQERLDRLEK